MWKRKHARSLEWACAAARLEGKRGAACNDYADDDDDDDSDDVTDDEDFHEAITPMGSLMGDASGDVFLDRRSIKGKRPTNGAKPKGPEEELMGAAILLCGLGRRVSRIGDVYDCV